MSKLFSMLTEVEPYRKTFSLIIELPDEGSVSALGELRNILSKEDGTYFRLGFKLYLQSAELRKLRSYIMKRQKEILDKLKNL